MNQGQSVHSMYHWRVLQQINKHGGEQQLDDSFRSEFVFPVWKEQFVKNSWLEFPELDADSCRSSSSDVLVLLLLLLDSFDPCPKSSERRRQISIREGMSPSVLWLRDVTILGVEWFVDINIYLPLHGCFHIWLYPWIPWYISRVMDTYIYHYIYGYLDTSLFSWMLHIYRWIPR